MVSGKQLPARFLRFLVSFVRPAQSILALAKDCAHLRNGNLANPQTARHEEQTPLRSKKQPPSEGFGGVAIAEAVMARVMVRMSCLVCGHRWAVKVDAEDEELELVDDLCPVCQSQGEPEEVVEDHSYLSHGWR